MRKPLLATLLITVMVVSIVYGTVWRACVYGQLGGIWSCGPLTAQILGHQLRERMGP